MIKIFKLGPAVSLNGSPTVSPTTAALCASLPFPPCAPLSINFFARLCESGDVRGNLVADAWFAALAIESGCEWTTLDRDYGRFEGLRWRLPERSARDPRA